MTDLLVVVCIVVAAGALAYLVVVAIRWANRRHARQTTTEPVSPTAVATARRVLLRLVRWTQRGGDEDPAPTAPDQPDAPQPEHEGATEDWSPAAAVAKANTQHSDAPAPDWDTQHWLREGNAADHAALNALEDDFHHDVEHLWNGFYDRLGVDAKTRLRLASAVDDTGEIDGAELAALLEGVGA